MEEDILKWIKTVDQNVTEIIMESYKRIPYVNLDNFYRNAETLHRSLVIDHFFGENTQMVGAYLSGSNQLVIDAENFKRHGQYGALLVLHEYVHMMSTNLDTGLMGFDNGTLQNKMFNDAAAQWFACKLFQCPLENNPIYPESVSIFDDLIQKFGEEKMFQGFFEADLPKFEQSFSKEELDFIHSKKSEMNKTPEAEMMLLAIRKLEANVHQLRMESKKTQEEKGSQEQKTNENTLKEDNENNGR